MEIIELQNAIAQQLALSVEEAWDSIQFHYENATVDGLNREIFVAVFFNDGIKNQFTPTLEALDLFLTLRNSQPEGQNEEWTWLEFILERTGTYKFDYKYGLPPQIEIAIKYSKTARGAE
jgi:hypothetical protein